MLKRVLVIVGLIALLVIGSNGYLHNWLGYGTLFGNHASLIGAGSRVDVRAVQAWARVDVAREMCDMAVTDRATALKRVNWDDDPLARRTIAEIRKESEKEGKEAFCNKVWTAYGPSGSVMSGLIERKDG